MNFKKIFAISLCAFVFSIKTFAITVDQIPALVKQSNQDVHAANTDVAAAKEEERVALSRYFPKIEVKNAYTHLDHDIVLDIPPQRIEKDFLGGDLKVGIDVDPPPITVQKQDFFTSQLVVTQPLYAGGRIGAGMDAATAQHKEAELSYKHTYDEKLVEALTRYFQAKVAAGVLEVLKEVRADLDRLHAIAEAAIKTGAVSKFRFIKSVSQKQN